MATVSAEDVVLGYRDGHLVVYSETHVDVFNCATGEWVQTINVKRAKPLNDGGGLTMSLFHDASHLLYLSNIHQRECLGRFSISSCDARFAGELLNLDNIVTLDREGRTVQRPRRRFSLREGNRAQRMLVIREVGRGFGCYGCWCFAGARTGGRN